MFRLALRAPEDGVSKGEAGTAERRAAFHSHAVENAAVATPHVIAREACPREGGEQVMIRQTPTRSVNTGSSAYADDDEGV